MLDKFVDIDDASSYMSKHLGRLARGEISPNDVEKYARNTLKGAAMIMGIKLGD